jgi:NADH dehydrogenase (ubiquinone) 1 alpha subcomplex subunit 5
LLEAHKHNGDQPDLPASLLDTRCDIMRSSARLLATAARYLEANTPTGLTGLSTHPAPRSALIYTYNKTLEKLRQIPDSSVYRQSVENLTKHRLAIVEEQVPEGFEAWKERVQKQIDASPAAYGKFKGSDGSFSYSALAEEMPIPWDGLVSKKTAQNTTSVGLADAEAKVKSAKAEVDVIERENREGVLPTVDDLEAEPPLTAEQYGHLCDIYIIANSA